MGTPLGEGPLRATFHGDSNWGPPVLLQRCPKQRPLANLPSYTCLCLCLLSVGRFLHPECRFSKAKAEDGKPQTSM